MKKVIRCVILILATNLTSYSQDIDLKESELSELLLKDWKLDYGLLNGNKVQGLEIVNDEFSFKSNHTYKLGSNKSSFVDGTWKFNVEKKRVELYSETGNSSGYIKFVDKTKMIILPGEKSVPENFKIEFTFIPKE